MAIFKLNQETKKETIHNLLKYCELDTYAMVKLYQKLVELSKGDE